VEDGEDDAAIRGRYRSDSPGGGGGSKWRADSGVGSQTASGSFLVAGIVAGDVVFPVFGASGGPGGDLEEICGTAFCIGPGVFLTAGHVLERAFTHQVAAIGYPGDAGSKWRGSSIDERELFDDLDIGICKARVPDATQIPWGRGEPLLLSEEVQTVGYPYGLDLALRTVVVRAFQGHIVSERKFGGLPGLPTVYELSFPCPRGISGAPIFTTEGDGRVAGVIISNAIMEMEVYSEREVVREPPKETILIKTEALHLGIAITPREILALRSRLLGGTVHDWLTMQGLLEA
jgi:hypothetical protein